MDLDIDPPHALFLFPIIFFSSIDLGITISILILILLIISSALISGSEIAFFSLSPDQLNSLEHDTQVSGKRILSLRKKPRKLLATILISNNFVNIAIVLVSDYLIKGLLGESLLLAWGEELKELYIFKSLDPQSIGELINFIIAVVGVTTILVLFGEIMPKIYANINNLKLSRFMASPIGTLMIIFSPISNILVRWTNIFENKMGNKVKSSSNADREDIEEALDVTLQSDEHELDILKSIIKFSEVSVKQIMKPRNDVVSIDKIFNFDQVLEVVRESGFSRIPIFEEDFDNLIGILYAKDLISYLDKGINFHWHSLIRKKIHYVPESKKINELLKEFQNLKLHIGIVVDEYGGSAGIITMEDIMEEILGEILDEFDEVQEDEFIKIDEKTYLFEGKTLLIDFVKIFDEDVDVFDIIKGEADSLGGLILETAGEIPPIDYRIHMLKFDFIVEEVTERRIETVKVLINEIVDESKH